MSHILQLIPFCTLTAATERLKTDENSEINFEKNFDKQVLHHQTDYKISKGYDETHSPPPLFFAYVTFSPIFASFFKYVIKAAFQYVLQRLYFVTISVARIFRRGGLKLVGGRK